MTEINDASNQDRIQRSLAVIDRRLHAVEQRLGIVVDEPASPATRQTIHAENDTETLEYRIGRNVLPKIGVVVFTLGVVFLLTLPLTDLPRVLSESMGFIFSAVLFLLSRYWASSVAQFSRYLSGGAMLLLFLSTLRLHYFGTEPVLGSTVALFLVLAAVTVVNLFLSARAKSSYLSAMSLLMGFIAVLTIESPLLTFMGIMLMSLITAWTVYRNSWTYIFSLGIAFAVIAHLLWAINKPLFGNPIVFQIVQFEHLMFLLLYVLIYGVAVLSHEQCRDETDAIIIASLCNAALPLFLLLGLGSLLDPTGHGILQLLLALIYLALGSAFWIRHRSRYSTFIYAMAGSMALSAAIMNQFPIPQLFLWLCLQSLLVISLAIWFRSRFIVVTNFGIFLAILLAYLLLTPSIGGHSLVFGVVALLSARIMGWQRDRLELKADALRNSYLLTALFVFPFTLHHMLPAVWVSLSWVGVALLYYVLGKILRNYKYRWMAMTTLILAVFHVLIIGTTGLDATFRILSFIVIGIVLLIVSLWYLKSSERITGASMKKNHEEQKDNTEAIS